MNWWQQMPWIIALSVAFIGPFIGGIAAMFFRRIESRDLRSQLIADAELRTVFTDSPASVKLQKSLDIRLALYIDELERQSSEPAGSAAWRKIVRCFGFLSIASSALLFALIISNSPLAADSDKPVAVFMLLVGWAYLGLARPISRALARTFARVDGPPIWELLFKWREARRHPAQPPISAPTSPTTRWVHRQAGTTLRRPQSDNPSSDQCDRDE